MQECEELVAKGITGTGQGFDAPGRRLGGFSHQPPVSSLRQAAVAAAAKRARVGALLPSGPKRLGGNSEIMDALSPIQAAAMAAERRMYDDLWCGSVSDEPTGAVESICGISKYPSSTEQGDSSRTSDDGVRGEDFVLRGPSNIDKVGSSSHSKCKNHESMTDCLSGGAPVAGGSTSHYPKDGGEDQAIWECSLCTLFNQVRLMLYQLNYITVRNLHFDHFADFSLQAELKLYYVNLQHGITHGFLLFPYVIH